MSPSREKLIGDLFQEVAPVADLLKADPDWLDQNDDLGVEVAGLVLFGYAFGFGRLILLMEAEDIETAMVRVLTERLGVATKWATGLVDHAGQTIFDKSRNPNHHALIGFGHDLFVGQPPEVIVNTIFEKTQVLRRFMAG